MEKNNRKSGGVAVVGLGNELLMDDGIGVRLVRELARERLPEGISVHEIGSAIFAVPALVAPGRRLLVADAMRGGEKPGRIYIEDFRPGRFTGDSQTCRTPSLHSLHAIRIFDLPEFRDPWVEAAAAWRVFGVEPQEIKYGYGLTPLLAEALPSLTAALKDEVLRMAGCQMDGSFDT